MRELRLGITAFDTADAYGGGRSETWMGRWMAVRGHRPSLTTKVFHSVVGDPADRGLSRERILRHVEGSLERLGVDRLDTYMLHAQDPDTPVQETMRAIAGRFAHDVSARAVPAPGRRRRLRRARAARGGCEEAMGRHADPGASAIRLLAERSRVIAEGAGALAPAAALSGRAGEDKIVCIVSGGNIDFRVLSRILAGETP